MIERNIIGCMLFDKEAAERCVEELQISDFANITYSTIFATAKKLYVSDTAIDLISMANELNKSQITCVTTDFLMQIVSEIWSSAQVESRIKELKEYAFRRRVLNHARKLAEKAETAEIEKLINAVSDIPEVAVEDEEKSAGKLMQEAINRMAERYNSDEALTISGNATGFRDLDKTTDGMKNGEVILITAEPNVGKSILAHQIGVYVAKQGKHVVSANFEMNANQIGDRTVAMALPFEMQKIKSPQVYLTDADLRYLEVANIDKIIDKYLHIYTNASSKTVPYIRSKCKKIQAMHGSISLIIVDYLQMMEGEGEEWEIAGKNCRQLKSLAGEFKCPVLLIASLSKDGKVRGSGQIDYDVDQKWYIRRQHDAADELSRAKTEIVIQKNRDGGKGIINLIFQEKYIRFVGNARWT